MSEMRSIGSEFQVPESRGKKCRVEWQMVHHRGYFNGATFIHEMSEHEWGKNSQMMYLKNS